MRGGGHLCAGNPGQPEDSRHGLRVCAPGTQSYQTDHRFCQLLFHPVERQARPDHPGRDDPVLGRWRHLATDRAGMGQAVAEHAVRQGHQPGGRGRHRRGRRRRAVGAFHSAAQVADRHSAGHRHGRDRHDDDASALRVDRLPAADTDRRPVRLLRRAHECPAATPRPRPDECGPFHRRAELQ